MIVLRIVCALTVVGICWGDPALYPESGSGPHNDLHHVPRYDLYNNRHYNMYNNPHHDVYNDLDDDLTNGVHRVSPLDFHNSRLVPAVFSRQPPAVPAHRTPAVTVFNAPAIRSHNGPTVVPRPYLVPPNIHTTLPQHESPVIVHKTPLPYARPVPQPKPVIPIKSQYHEQDEFGQYSFGYDAGISTRQETRDAYGTVRGSFSYIDSNGELQIQHYVADKGGFRVRGTNLPVHVTNQIRHKRSYATFPASTGPLHTTHPFPDVSAATPYYVYGPPRRSFSYSLQSFPTFTTSHRNYYPEPFLGPHRGYSFYY